MLSFKHFLILVLMFLVLCGPPGSGKTMTLFSALRALPDMEVVGLNFSSATTPELLLKTFDHYCEYRKTPNGVILSPVQVILSFCGKLFYIEILYSCGSYKLILLCIFNCSWANG